MGSKNWGGWIRSSDIWMFFFSCGGGSERTGNWISEKTWKRRSEHVSWNIWIASIRYSLLFYFWGGAFSTRLVPFFTMLSYMLSMLLNVEGSVRSPLQGVEARRATFVDRSPESWEWQRMRVKEERVLIATKHGF